LAVAAFDVIHQVTGAPNRSSGLTTPIPLSDALWRGGFAFLLVFAVSYSILIFFPDVFRSRDGRHEFFCPRCLEPMSPAVVDGHICRCGVRLEPIDWWRWRDEPAQTT